MEEETLYGELAIVGFNGIRKFSDRDPRRQSKIALYKRPVANGVRPGPVNRVLEPGDSCAVRSHSRHSVSYTLSRHETVVVEYIPDPNTDMFQIGRSTNSHIDFVVLEPRPSGSSRKRHDRRTTVPTAPVEPPVAPGVTSVNDKPPQDCACPSESAVSRFACRIHIDREPPHTARIYAAGFDAAKNIVLGELAVKWRSRGQMDGLTTNGVMILHANPDSLDSDSGDSSSPQVHWREVSIGGDLYEMRDKRCVPTIENRVDEDNVLQDKTLIDLCGVTLFWRSASSLSQTANANDLRMMVDGLNLARFQCPIMYRTLRLSLSVLSPKSDSPLADDCPTQTETPSEPYVYLNCGHVHGWHTWVGEVNKDTVDRTCPLCLQPSPFVPLRMGLEPAFYIDRALATYCFNPCGHMASEKTVIYWCSVRLPNMHNFELRPRCPFCLTPVESKPVRLRFQGDTDTDTLVQLLNAVLTANSSPPELMPPLPSLDQSVMSAK